MEHTKNLRIDEFNQDLAMSPRGLSSKMYVSSIITHDKHIIIILRRQQQQSKREAKRDQTQASRMHTYTFYCHV